MSASGRPKILGEEDGPVSEAVGSGTVVGAEEASGFLGVVSITMRVSEMPKMTTKTTMESRRTS